MNTCRKLQPNTDNDIWFFNRWSTYKKREEKYKKKEENKEEKKKLEEKSINCSTYLALMLNKTTQPATSLSFEGYFKIQLLLETTMRRSQDSKKLRLWMASTHAGMDFFYPPSQLNKKTDYVKQKNQRNHHNQTTQNPF